MHKKRNVREHVLPSHVAYVMSAMNEAYKSATADTARKRLRQLVSWLEANGEDAAAKSLREGLEETLTVIKLSLPATLRSSLSTTNILENVNSSIRRDYNGGGWLHERLRSIGHRRGGRAGL